MNWRDIAIAPSATIREALEVINKSGTQIALVTDGDILRGVVSDGNIRQGLLADKQLQHPVSTIMTKNPMTVPEGASSQAARTLLMDHMISVVPEIDTQRRVIRIWTRMELQHQTRRENPVVLMAGGLGSRLGKLTQDCPKPMLHVGGKPILELVLQNFLESGFRNFYICVNYMADQIEEHFGDGTNFGVSITYIREKQRMGTAGALSLLPKRPEAPIIVMNGDILTRFACDKLLDAHLESGAMATMAIKPHKVHIPYGVIRHDEQGLITKIQEKPTHKYPISAGIYVLSPEALTTIPPMTFFDMPDLFTLLIEQGHPLKIYEVTEYWLDIGRMVDYDRANEEFHDVFPKKCHQ